MNHDTNGARFLAAAAALAAAVACQSSGPPEPAVKLTPPAHPKADEAAGRAVAKPLEILATRIEAILPPSLYSEVTLRAQDHEHREFQTKTGRRISLTPPQPPSERPAWITVGAWKLASTGPIEVLFAVEPGAAAARVRAHGVSVLARDGRTSKGLASVQVDDEAVTSSESP